MLDEARMCDTKRDIANSAHLMSHRERESKLIITIQEQKEALEVTFQGFLTI